MGNRRNTDGYARGRLKDQAPWLMVHEPLYRQYTRTCVQQWQGPIISDQADAVGKAYAAGQHQQAFKTGLDGGPRL